MSKLPAIDSLTLVREVVEVRKDHVKFLFYVDMNYGEWPRYKSGGSLCDLLFDLMDSVVPRDHIVDRVNAFRQRLEKASNVNVYFTKGEADGDPPGFCSHPLICKEEIKKHCAKVAAEWGVLVRELQAAYKNHANFESWVWDVAVVYPPHYVEWKNAGADKEK